MDEHYFDQAKPQQVVAQYPVAEGFQTIARTSVDQRRMLQERRFAAVMARAWQIPFYQKHWRRGGLEPGDIRGLEDLPQLPPFTKSDLMASVAEHPPWGDFHGLDRSTGARYQAIVHSTSGTTGEPQPLFFGAWDREVQNALLARVYRMHGLRDTDVVHSVYGFGLVNGGHYVREAITHYTRALLLTPGTGLETPSERQVQLMARFGVTVLVGFADYLFRLADVARSQGLEPGRDLPVRLISGHIPHQRREALAAAWGGAQVLDWYGVGDTGAITAETEPGGGLWVFEDAHWLELIDPDTSQPVPDGIPGNQCVTVLFKDTVYPIVRFNTQDLSAIITGSAPANGWTLRRTRGFLGRSDNMVKLRGINVYPTAIGGMLNQWPQATGEYLCRLRRAASSGMQPSEASAGETLTIEVEWDGPRHVQAEATVTRKLQEQLGVRVEVVLVAPQSTEAATGVNARQKPIRLVDER